MDYAYNIYFASLMPFLQNTLLVIQYFQLFAFHVLELYALLRALSRSTLIYTIGQLYINNLQIFENVSDTSTTDKLKETYTDRCN